MLLLKALVKALVIAPLLMFLVKVARFLLDNYIPIEIPDQVYVTGYIMSGAIAYAYAFKGYRKEIEEKDKK